MNGLSQQKIRMISLSIFLIIAAVLLLCSLPWIVRTLLVCDACQMFTFWSKITVQKAFCCLFFSCTRPRIVSYVLPFDWSCFSSTLKMLKKGL